MFAAPTFFIVIIIVIVIIIIIIIIIIKGFDYIINNIFIMYYRLKNYGYFKQNAANLSCALHLSWNRY